MRPPGPLPAIARGSIPASAAARLARGLIRRRPSCPSGRAGAGAAVPGAAAVAVIVAGAAAGAATGAAAADGSGAAGVAAAVTGSGIVSPGSPTYAQTVFTGIVAPTSAMIRRRTPSSNASTSMVDLSVSISKRMSPLLTGSPSFLCQAMTVHSSVIWPGFGMRIACAMTGSFSLPSVGDVKRLAAAHRRPFAAS